MKQEEVDLIYDYLHENYHYEDGELITKKDIKHSKRKGDKLGSFFYQGTGGSPKMRGCLTVNNKKYNMTLGHLIWIFYHKEKAIYIHHADLNPLNNKIENLQNTSLTQLQGMCREKRKGYTEKVNKNGSISYRVQIEHNYKKINIGTFICKETARKIYEDSRNILENGITCAIKIRKKIAEKYPNENIKITHNNQFGLKGVCQNHNRFVARLKHNKQTIIIGTFDTPEEAHQAYLKAKEVYKT